MDFSLVRKGVAYKKKFWKIQEILFLMSTRIFQIGLLGADKIDSRVGNPTK